MSDGVSVLPRGRGHWRANADRRPQFDILGRSDQRAGHGHAGLADTVGEDRNGDSDRDSDRGPCSATRDNPVLGATIAAPHAAVLDPG